MPTTVLDTFNEKEHAMTVMTGIDPHKGSHTAVAVPATTAVRADVILVRSCYAR